MSPFLPLGRDSGRVLLRFPRRVVADAVRGALR